MKKLLALILLIVGLPFTLVGNLLTAIGMAFIEVAGLVDNEVNKISKQIREEMEE